MKLMKAMKKLNFWSKKKRKNDYYYSHYKKLPHYNNNFKPYYNPPPPPPHPPPPLPPPPLPMVDYERHFCHPTEPSAPPLPPWLEEGISSNFTFAHCSNDQETLVKTASTSSVGPTLRHGMSRDINSSSQLQEIVTATTSSSSSLVLQQPSPGPSLSPEKASTVGLFGCVVDVSGLLFRCIFPCFHISEPWSLAVDDHHMEKKTF